MQEGTWRSCSPCLGRPSAAWLFRIACVSFGRSSGILSILGDAISLVGLGLRRLLYLRSRAASGLLLDHGS
jgi:hypothetical protein